MVRYEITPLNELLGGILALCRQPRGCGVTLSRQQCRSLIGAERRGLRRAVAFCAYMASMASCSTPSSARDSRACSNRSPACDAAMDAVSGAAGYSEYPNRAGS
ncbi:hypothetical protein BD413DRAFT_143081 [Trametes elegans]|nr:hypothetical protein BD413DRAFT_143081 [Trametes elegans]